MRIDEAMVDLAACLCAQIAADGLPPTCFCGVVPGATPDASYFSDCDTRDGMAWVRMANTYPASGVGVVDQTLGNCSTGIGVDLEVGIIRSIPIQEEALDEAQTLAATQLQVMDALAARKAVACCSAFSSKDYIIGMYTPIGPQGGVVGGAWTVHLAVD